MPRAALIALLLLAFVLPASPSWGWLYLPTRDRDTGLVEIFEAIESGGADSEAVRALEDYIRDHPSGASTDEALMRLARIHSTLGDGASAAAAYEKLLEWFPGTAFKFEALFELAVIRYNNGELKAARSLAAEVGKSGLSTIGLRVRARRLIKEIDTSLMAYAPEADSPAIGVMLPLKGRYSQYGEAALRGVLLAAEVFGEPYGAVTVHVRDVETDPALALDAVGELTAKDRVLGLVGPLLSATSAEVAGYAQKKRIPLVTLSQKEGITMAGDYVFRNFLTPAQQAAAIAEYSIGVMQLERFAVMYPENSYGAGMARLFEAEVVERGGEVVRVLPYKYGNRDFSEQITYLFDIVVEQRTEGRRSIREYTPTEDIDAVFMPDTFEAASLAASYFDYYNIEGVTLLGTNGWNNPEFVRLAGRHAEGAVFVDGFFAGSERAGTSEFTRRYRETYGLWPGVLEAQAYDAARVMITAIYEEAGAEPDRREVKARLKRMGSFEGAAGRMTFDPDGEAVKELFVLTVKKGRIMEAPEFMAEPDTEPEFDFLLPEPGAVEGAYPVPFDIYEEPAGEENGTDTY